MSIRLILFFPLVSNYCQVMQLKRNEMYKISFFVIDDLITQEKIRKQIFFWRGGGGGGGMINCQSSHVAVNCRTKFRNTHIGLRKAYNLGR